VPRVQCRGLRRYQQAFLAETARDAVCYSCTGVGKTWVCAAWICQQALRHPGTVWGWYAPTEKQLVTGFNTVVAILSAIGMFAGKVEAPGSRIVRTTAGAVIAFASWHDPETLRGPHLAGAVVDEAGLLTPAAYGVISSRRSATLGPIRWIGNPGLSTGVFRQLCEAGEAPDRDPRLVATYRWTWRDMAAEKRCDCRGPVAVGEHADPTLHDSACDRRAYLEFIRQERRTLPDGEYRRLYEAEWTADEAAIFRPECIASKTTGAPAETPTPGHRYVIGVDVGQEVDYLVAAVWDANETRLCGMERWRGVPSPESEARLHALSQHWGNAPLTIETNGPGRPLFDGLAHRGAPTREWVTTAQSKGPAILAFARDLHDPDSTLSLAPLPPLQDELRAFRFERTLNGYRYTAPSGMHDDCVMAAVVGHQALIAATMPLMAFA
jgi:hypothetical protein